MEKLARSHSMLSWDLVKAHPATYRAIDGATSFEVMVGSDNRKDAITVTRTEGDKFEIKVFRDRGKALRWCEKHPWRYESFFSLFRL
jgi:hypothetical protein